MSRVLEVSLIAAVLSLGPVCYDLSVYYPQVPRIDKHLRLLQQEATILYLDSSSKFKLLDLWDELGPKYNEEIRHLQKIRNSLLEKMIFLDNLLPSSFCLKDNF